MHESGTDCYCYIREHPVLQVVITVVDVMMTQLYCVLFVYNCIHSNVGFTQPCSTVQCSALLLRGTNIWCATECIAYDVRQIVKEVQL